MSFDATTLHRIASLARLDVPADQLASLGAEMSAILVLVDQLQGVDTKGVAPLAHPLSVVSEMALRLRPDAACTEINREANMQNAPMTENGLFLVPKVLD
ncbi:MAG: Asp-tRNA(Asn)/Glu-tRNA(Gln) amidotransferase subunit GatC [Burkholderiales bacterium]|nr:Asp-tRNA(Asn)/Glu-tRNA(Gln) amidotransferase subunit GatC [Betaproteobacteria bacterium]